MTTSMVKELRWVKRARVPEPTPSAPVGALAPLPTPRERLVAALAERPRTVTQLAQAFGLSLPTMLEQVRRALRDGLIVEVDVAAEERRFAAERYYAPAVPVVRLPDRELLESACRAVTNEFAAALATNLPDLRAAFALTHLAREGWDFDALWPYLQETIQRGVAARLDGPVASAQSPPHGLAWVEDVPEQETTPEWREESA